MIPAVKQDLLNNTEIDYNIKEQPIFFSNENIKLYNASCLDKNILNKESVDLIITSPPYNVGIN